MNIERDFKNIYSGIRGVLIHEGVKSLISRGCVFLLRRAFLFENYFVILTDTENTPQLNEADFKPKTDDYCSKIISTNQEADQLVSSGFDLAAYELDLRSLPGNGVTVICIFVGKELAHINAVAENPRGKKILDPRPFSVNFKNSEAVTGRTLTVPKYRRLYLRTYSGYLLRKHCHDKGIRWIKGTVNADNYATLSGMSRTTDHTALSKYQFIKIFCFKYLKEKKIEQISTKRLIKQIPNHSKSKSRE
jgi:hypothetical protein